MKPALFEDNPEGRMGRRLLTGVLVVLIGLLLLRVAGRSWAPAWLPIDRYNLLVPAALIAALWRLLTAGSLRISRRSAIGWLFAAVAGVTILFFQPHVDSDGDYFYAYLRSILWDGDFNLSNEAAWYATGWMKGHQEAVNATTGYVYSGATIGCAMFWLPFVAAAHPVALILQAVGYPIAADGYDLIYRLAVSLGTWTYVLCGLWICVRLLETWFQRSVALVAVLAMYLASPQLCYGFHSGSFSHGISFFLMSLGLFVWIRQRNRPTVSSAVRIGFLLGMACLVRPQNALWLALPFMDRIFQDGLSRVWKDKILWLVCFVGSSVLAFMPQLVLWYIERGGLFAFPQGPGFVDTGRWNQWRVLFHPWHGLFIWHPLHLLAFIGLIGFVRKNRFLGALLLLGIVLQIGINGSVEAWHAGGAFGQRRFESSMPLFMIGLAYLLQRMCVERSLWAIAVTGLSCLVLWNFLLLAQVVEGPLYYSSPMDLGTIWSDQRLVAPGRLEIWASRAPLIRWLVVGIADRSLVDLAAWSGLIAVMGGLFVLATWLAPRMLVFSFAKQKSSVIPWCACLAAPCILTAVILAANAAATRVPIALRQEGDVLVTRNLALHSPEWYEGGCARFALGPGEKRNFSLFPSASGRTLMLVGGQQDESVPQNQPALRVQVDSIQIDVLSGQFPPIHPAAAPSSHRPSSAYVVRTEYPGWGAKTPSYSYGCLIPLGAMRTLDQLRLTNLTKDATLAIDGIAILPEAAPSPELTKLSVRGPKYQQKISIDALTNADYRHNPFHEHDRSSLNFYPLLNAGIYESGGIRFRILPSVDEMERWSVLGILHKTDRFSVPLPAEQYDGVSLAWAAYGTCVRTKPGGPPVRLPPEQLAVVRLEYADGTNETHEIVSHRDIYDWRDRYVPKKCLVYQEALYQKICRTDLQVGRPDTQLRSIVIDSRWQTDGIGLALFAVTAWREK
ncbi:MAG: hypothetical protein ABIH23_35210 [bacterium]